MDDNTNNATTTFNKRPPKDPSSHTLISPIDELRTLKTAVDDLHTKRLSALRLYHEEKALRQQETSKIGELTARIHSLQQQLKRQPPHSSATQSIAPQEQHNLKQSHPEQAVNDNVITTVQTNDFSANVQSIHRLPSISPHSLTWYSKCMQSVMRPPSTVIAILHTPIEQQESPKSITQSSTSTTEQQEEQQEVQQKQQNQHQQQQQQHSIIEDERKEEEQNESFETRDVHIHDDQSHDNSTSATKEEEEDHDVEHDIDTDDHSSTDISQISQLQSQISELTLKLSQSQNQSIETHQELMRSQQLIADLKTQVEASTQACKDLIQTINEQEETISHLS